MAFFLPRSKIQGKVEFEALKSSGDGNCLYRSASLMLFGHEDVRLLLRLLTAIELFLHASYYAIHPKFLSCMKSPFTKRHVELLLVAYFSLLYNCKTI